MPGIGNMLPPGINLDDKELVRIEAIIRSMTRLERDDPHVLIREPSRVTRISRGSGQPAQGVSELVQKFLFMQQMMSNLGGLGGLGGLLGKIPGMGGLGMARAARRALKNQGAGGGIPGLPGMGLPGQGMPPLPSVAAGAGGQAIGTPRMRTLSKAERNARKNQRKRERAARKKGKGKR
jgi:signal recognition particle subunit SRP54